MGQHKQLPNRKHHATTPLGLRKLWPHSVCFNLAIVICLACVIPTPNIDTSSTSRRSMRACKKGMLSIVIGLLITGIVLSMLPAKRVAAALQLPPWGEGPAPACAGRSGGLPLEARSW